MAHKPDSLSFPSLHHLVMNTCSSANVYWQTTTKVNVKCKNKSSYLLAEQFRQNTGRFKFDIFKLGDLLRYKPLQSIRFKTKKKMLALSYCRCLLCQWGNFSVSPIQGLVRRTPGERRERRQTRIYFYPNNFTNLTFSPFFK